MADLRGEFDAGRDDFWASSGADEALEEAAASEPPAHAEHMHQCCRQPVGSQGYPPYAARRQWPLMALSPSVAQPRR